MTTYITVTSVTLRSCQILQTFMCDAMRRLSEAHMNRIYLELIIFNAHNSIQNRQLAAASGRSNDCLLKLFTP